jgi:tetratricopeptide (TPR) repeat protein
MVIRQYSGRQVSGRLLFGAVVGLAISLSQVHGQTRKDTVLETCESAQSDAFKRDDAIAPGIAACTQVLARTSLSTKNRAIIHGIRGYWKHKAKDFDGAMADYNRALELDRNYFEGYDYRADLWVDIGNDERALADYEQALRIDPNYAAAYYSRGKIFERRGDLRSAREAYEAALRVPKRDRIAEWAQRQATTALNRLQNAGQPTGQPTNQPDGSRSLNQRKN